MPAKGIIRGKNDVQSLLQAIRDSTGGMGGVAGVTSHFATLGASASQVIPAGAKGWAATILTGTGTIGGQAVIAGQSVEDTNTLAAPVTVTTDASSSAFVRWNT